MNNFQNILFIDSSKAHHLVIVLTTHNDIIQKDYFVDHLESELIPKIDVLLKQVSLSIKDMDAFVLGAGPGSFMGLRLGFSTLRTWAWLNDTPITLISSLELLKRSFCAKQSANCLNISCIDAKMKRVFAQIVLGEKILLEDCDIFPEKLAETIEKFEDIYKISQTNIIGSGSIILESYLKKSIVHFYPEVEISAQSITKEFLNAIPLSKFSRKSVDQLEKILPNYLRVSAAEMSLQEKTTISNKNLS